MNKMTFPWQQFRASRYILLCRLRPGWIWSSSSSWTSWLSCAACWRPSSWLRPAYPRSLSSGGSSWLLCQFSESTGSKRIWKPAFYCGPKNKYYITSKCYLFRVGVSIYCTLRTVFFLCIFHQTKKVYYKQIFKYKFCKKSKIICLQF